MLRKLPEVFRIFVRRFRARILRLHVAVRVLRDLLLAQRTLSKPANKKRILLGARGNFYPSFLRKIQNPFTILPAVFQSAGAPVRENPVGRLDRLRPPVPGYGIARRVEDRRSAVRVHVFSHPRIVQLVRNLVNLRMRVLRRPVPPLILPFFLAPKITILHLSRIDDRPFPE